MIRWPPRYRGPHRRPRLKVRVNHDVCEGHGKCVKAAPEVFELRDDDLSHVKLEVIPAHLQEAVRLAVRLCPRQAVTVEE